MGRFLVQATWDDVPHLTGDAKTKLWEAIPPHMRDARAKGIPMLGAGQIYPVPEESILVDPFPIPAWWPRAYGFDADWNNTAAVWGAWDRDSDTVYLWSAYYAGQLPPAVHASAIKARGAWMVGAMDPSTHGKISPKDGKRLSEEYAELDLRLVDAENAVEAGIFACYQRMTRGGLKVFRTLNNWLAEFRIYRRDEHGHVVKQQDHLMDATRYLLMTGMQHARTSPDLEDEADDELARRDRNAWTGY